MSAAYVEIVGGVSGLLTTIAFFPQALKVYKTRDTSSISLIMFVILNIGLAGWVYYGILMQQIPVIIPNIVTLMLASYILIIKILEKKQ
jgi:MtN3 and saliva related transmembrane protein